MKSCKIALSTLSLGLMLAAPIAFAQDAASAAAPAPAQAAEPQAQPAAPAAANDAVAPQAQAAPAQAAAPADQPKQITWSDLDTDKDGKLNKTEVAPVQALTQVFDSADTDKDGMLTPDEYKAYVAKNAAGTNASGNSGG